jgi:hypothetical protein
MAYDAEPSTPKVDVNVVEILRLADFMEKLRPKKISMHSYVNENSCGTTACIAGWAILTKAIQQEPEKAGYVTAYERARTYVYEQTRDRAYNYAYEQPGHIVGIARAAAATLGLNQETAHKLFHDFPGSCGANTRQPSKKQVVRTLRHLAVTGEVKWNAV